MKTWMASDNKVDKRGGELIRSDENERMLSCGLESAYTIFRMRAQTKFYELLFLKTVYQWSNRCHSTREPRKFEVRWKFWELTIKTASQAAELKVNDLVFWWHCRDVSTVSLFSWRLGLWCLWNCNSCGFENTPHLKNEQRCVVEWHGGIGPISKGGANLYGAAMDKLFEHSHKSKYNQRKFSTTVLWQCCLTSLGDDNNGVWSKCMCQVNSTCIFLI
jgi:hypothetical protein